jgi:16S rRNA (cytosine967-C5)-methyltransferase
MTPSARISAAIEVLADIDTRRRPASDALKDWGLMHRFAGSGDRAAIGGLVYDALRRKASAAFLLGEPTPRAILLGALKLERGLDAAAIARLCDGSRFAPSVLNEAEARALSNGSLADAPAYVAGDYPEWLDRHFARVFGDARADEGAALAHRAPLDLRVNTLKSDRDAAATALAHLKPTVTPWSPVGLRLTLTADAKSPGIHAEPAFLKGFVDVQDEGSQLAAMFAGVKPGEQVVDLCAGGGGKTLALAAAMGNSGQLYATDDDKRRLAPIHQRLERAGVRNVQVRTPLCEADPIADLAGRADLVVIDAPCTGSGTWRRNPDAKWRMRPGALDERCKEQTQVLERAAGLVKSGGGRIAYITCSVLGQENDDQVAAFLARHADFAVVSADRVTDALAERATAFREAVLSSEHGFLMTPRRTGTDGFFFSLLQRA